VSTPLAWLAVLSAGSFDVGRAIAGTILVMAGIVALKLAPT
jgi:hypothetical protein